GKAERLPDNSEHGDEAYNPMMPGQTAQSLKKPLIYEHELSSHGPSEHGAVRGTYTLSLPENRGHITAEDGEQDRTDVEAGVSGELDDEGKGEAGSNHTDDAY
ncbi:unnamed protein product, partial [Symbiodinium microadriaticum]